MNALIKVSILLATLAASSSALSQAEFIDRTRAFADLASFLKRASPALERYTDQGSILSTLRGDSKAVGEKLAWRPKGDGALWFVRSEKHIASGVVRTIRGYPELIGFGADVVDVLAMHEGNQLTGGISDGFQASKEDSLYVWAESSGAALKYYAVDYPKSEILEARALLRRSDAKVLSEIKAASDNRAYVAIVEKFRSDVASQETRKKVVELDTARREAAERLAAITREYISAVQSLAEGRTLSATLAGISGALTLAQIGGQIAAWKPDLSGAVSGAQNKEEALRLLDQQLSAQQTKVGSLQGQLTNQRSELSSGTDRMNDALVRGGVPSTVLPKAP